MARYKCLTAVLKWSRYYSRTIDNKNMDNFFLFLYVLYESYAVPSTLEIYKVFKMALNLHR